MKCKIIPVILCGGTGSRLWPLSRASFPKQFIDFNLNSKKSLLQQTQERIKNLENSESPILICNEEHRFIVAEQMREIEVTPRSIILEPYPRNTAPAIALAAMKALEFDKDAVILVLASDHKIKNNLEFINSIDSARDIAAKGKLITFGIIPSSPEIGYGYIEASHELIQPDCKAREIIKFIEKPDLNLAKKLIKNEKYTWNSGMFLFKASLIIKELKKYNPEIINCCKEAIKGEYRDLDFQRINKKAFQSCPSVSIDVAVMEKTTNGVVFPLEVGWNDIGSWKSLWEDEKRDSDQNVKSGDVYSLNTSGCYLRSENRLIVTLGIKDLVVIETNDAILVSNKNDSQKVKTIVNDLEKRGKIEAKKHRKIYRPWGNYISIGEDNRWQVKRIEVNPGSSLSLQMHYHRAEHWIVVKGVAKVQINEEELFLSENESTYIPLGAKHRLSNPGKMPLVLIEVQSGSYLGEDDILRFKDDYGR